MSGLGRALPGIVVAIAGLVMVLAALPTPAPAEAMNLDEFAALPVLDGGRVKPMDTLARVNLKIISGRESFKDESKKTQPAIKWLLDVLVSEAFKKDDARKHKVFRIENDHVLDLLGLPARPGFYRYSVDEMADKIDVLAKEAQRAKEVDPKQRDVFDAKILELADHLQLYMSLARLELRMTPPTQPNQEMQPLREVMVEAISAGDSSHPALPMMRLLRAYAGNRVDDFNKALADHRANIVKQLPTERGWARYEAFVNHFDPFFWCKWLYVAAFTLACLSWLVFPEPLNRSAFWLLVFTLAVHSYALLSRIVIQGYAPVTNLYSSAVFIGWAGMLLALVLESIFRNGLGSATAGIIGFATAQIASFLSENTGDTMEMLQPVLDTNFWLSTHVTTITFGYAATFVAGIIATSYLLLGVFTPWLHRDLAKTLTQMIYGVVCFAAFLSFTGTVLGGIWGDQSWGRFWGWDPKENGALILVLWNALILHARWGGLAKQRGIAVLAVVGNIVTAWSWFGTNQLGVGLHSYGFSKALADGLRVFWASQLAVIAVGLVPQRYWRSHQTLLQGPNPKAVIPKPRPAATPA